MDNTKWRSVLMSVSLYEVVKKLAYAEGRTLSGQLRVIVAEYIKSHNLSTIEGNDP